MIKRENKFDIRIVLAIQIILFVVGAVLGNFQELNKYTLFLISLLFILTSVYMYIKNRDDYNKFVCIAMIFCFFGDIIIAKFIWGGLMLGMGMFAVAHIFFIIAYTKTIKLNGGKIFNKSYLIAAIIYTIFFISLWSIFLLNTPNGAMFSFFSLLYGFLLSTMAAISVSLYSSNKNYLKTAIGAFMFLISDSVNALAQTMKIPHVGIIIWAAYVISLYGMIYSNNY